MTLAAITNIDFWVGFFGGSPIWFGCGLGACLACMSVASDFWQKRTGGK